MKKITFLIILFAFSFKINAQVGKGLNFNDKKYEQTSMKAPLTRSLYTAIPESYSLKQYAPIPKSQGNFGTCVGWSTAYAAMTIVDSRLNNRTDKDLITLNAYSPGFVYKQIKMSSDLNCTYGANIEDALEILKTKGAAKFTDITEANCLTDISNDLFNKAKNHKIKDYAKLFGLFDTNPIKISSTKKSLSQNNPVLIGMKVPDSFNYINGELWTPTEDYNSEFSGHAICVVGYDDNKYGGAFEIMNSWGETWGNKGFFWIKYEDYANWVKYAYEMIDMIGGKLNNSYELSGGVKFILTSGEETKVSYNGNYYRTGQSFKSGTMFRLNISNTSPAYVYAFGYDATGKIFEIFPYSPTISAALNYAQNDVAIPDEDHYIQTDNTIGNDYLCVVYSKEPLSVKTFYNAIENNKSSNSFPEKVKTAFGSNLISSSEIKFDQSKISFSAKSSTKSVVALIIETEHIE